MTDLPKKTNYFVRVLIVMFIIGLSFMIGYNFIAVEPIGTIKNGIFILLAIVLVLVLAESFDNFSIGKLISITREVEIKTVENKKLEQKNSELISQIISITNIQTQKNQTTTVLGDYYIDNKKENQSVKPDNDSVQELIDRIGNSIVISELENNIIAELQSKSFLVEGDTNKVLVRHLAGTQLILEFERIHSLIFGSQIFLLKQLNIAIPIGYSETDTYAFFEKVKQIHRDSFTDWDSEKYLTFLISKSLILKNEINEIHITNMGVEYLTWIARNGISDDRPL